ncbi:hypothetical protein A2W45_01670 [Candidatus Curtissbacteria bacterium RIFCSPHIGHO2_12_41_11]|uniref:DUF6602 domain-containing protein n=3 Tax=Candidatus Curtissiibacteriota TaxID=1752717 RepID=A0A1F5HQ82_9BACT|nr:MAG: hypothetical protein UU56_C0001G0006 [Candidatus Curtissbacteria bacterium GW2011_GWA2_41_24]OGD98075.1 MAG: hypothetical protein A2W45_01670 [Candidatus Curtissbacteria bacterium RIFCSPHIGHO2_12_41_11]OGE06311.1 MAG: hypothetical protein A2W70_03680 [Candidatus Curtissbacteria bacterium RIFCSPLOWO2_02_41_11]
MANINAPEVEFFESFASEIESKFQRIKSLVSHRVASGDYHEEIIRTVLRNFLSKRYSVKKGFIYKSQSEVSKQLDILIIDENSPAAYLFQEGDFAIVIPESVIAVMEIKTTLNSNDFDIAIENIASAKKLVEFPVNLTGIIFGFDGTSPSDKNLDNWFKRVIPAKFKDSPENVLGANMIMFFTAGCLLARYRDDGIWDLAGKYYHKMFRDDSVKKSISDTGWQLSVVLAMIVSSCERGEISRTGRIVESKALRLIQGDGSMISHSRFAFGGGVSKISTTPLNEKMVKK